MNSLRYFGQIIGNALPIELRDIDSLKKKGKKEIEARKLSL